MVHTSSHNSLVLLSNLAFVLLFPGFILYHSLISLGLMGDFFSGYFGLISAGFSVVYSFYSIRDGVSVGRYVSTVVALFFVFLSYIFLWTLIHFALNFSVYVNEAVIQSLEFIVFSFTLFHMGRNFDISNPTIKLTVKISLALILWFFLYRVGFGYYSTGASLFTGRVSSVGYQGYSRNCLVIILIALTMVPGRVVGIIVWIIGGWILFYVGARSEFYAYIFVTVFSYIFLAILRRSWGELGLGLVGVLVVLGILSFVFEADFSSRQFEVLDLQSSGSWLARLTMQDVAVSQISSSYILGNFGGHVEYFGFTGGYSHNALSSWVNYGLLGFVLYIGLSVYAVIFSMRGVVLSQGKSSSWLFSLLLSLTCLFLIILSKSVFWVLPALSWGVYANCESSSSNEFDVLSK